MFERFEVLAKKMPPYAVLKLAIEFDRHAMACDMAATKASEEQQARTWSDFQRYLHGETDIAFRAQGQLETPGSTVDLEDAAVHVHVDDTTALPSDGLDPDAAEEKP